MVNFPRNSCDHASALLGRYFQEQGFDVVYVNNGCRGGSSWKDSHAWLEIGDLIVDITADQFSDQTERVIVTTDHTWHSTFYGQRRQSVNDQLSFNNLLGRSYKQAYGEIKKELSKQ
jgi:hypothetical protein